MARQAGQMPDVREEHHAKSSLTLSHSKVEFDAKGKFGKSPEEENIFTYMDHYFDCRDSCYRFVPSWCFGGFDG